MDDYKKTYNVLLFIFIVFCIITLLSLIIIFIRFHYENLLYSFLKEIHNE